MARVAQLSTTFRRSVIELGLRPGSPGFRAVFSTIAALAATEELPGRVSGQNVWVLYRFDDARVFAMTTRSQPAVPIDD